MADEHGGTRMLEDFGRTEAGEATVPQRSGWMTGCLGAIALLFVLTIGAFVYKDVTNTTPAPLYLTQAQLSGPWSSPEGASINLHSNGTFTATGGCDFNGTTYPLEPGSGTWTPGTSADIPYARGPATGSIELIGATSATGGNSDILEGGSSGSPVLLFYLGPPQQSDFCTLHRR